MRDVTKIIGWRRREWRSAVLWSRRRVAVALAALAVAAGTDEVVPPPPDQAAGLAATFQQAVAAGTNAALIMFIARYPDEPLAERARRLLSEHETPDADRAMGPDADIVAAFDAARLRGSGTAMRDFALRFPGHPLAAEALRHFWER